MYIIERVANNLNPIVSIFVAVACLGKSSSLIAKAGAVENPAACS
jgi:hypothetical protein